MAAYEMIREIYNSCSRNAMRDVFVDEVETEDTAAYVAGLYKGRDAEISSWIADDGAAIYDVVTKGLSERYSFTPID